MLLILVAILIPTRTVLCYRGRESAAALCCEPSLTYTHHEPVCLGISNFTNRLTADICSTKCSHGAG